MNKEFELDENGNVIDKSTYGELMAAMGVEYYKKKYKKKSEPEEQPTPKKGIIFIDILDSGGCLYCPCCDGEQSYCTVLKDGPECNYKERLPECPIKEITITPEVFAERMRNIQELYSDYHDTEERHQAMDRLMCELLQELGYGEGIDIFEKTNKWYA